MKNELYDILIYKIVVDVNMWPFRKTSKGLIDAAYLEDNGIDSRYRNVFDWTKKDLKAEIKRNEMNIAEIRKTMSELDTKFQSNDMIRSELNTELDKLANDKDKNSQLFEKIMGERILITSQNKKITADKLNEMTNIENFTKTNIMLGSILNGRTKTIEQLTRKPLKYDYVEDALEGLPSEEEMLGDAMAEMDRRSEKLNKDEE